MRECDIFVRGGLHVNALCERINDGLRKLWDYAVRFG